VIVHLDTSALIDALTGPRRSLPRLAAVVGDGHRIAVSAPVFYEWRRGARRRSELAAQARLLPMEGIVAFGSAEAIIASDLYRRVSRPRGREMDLAIAACAIGHGAGLWTLNPDDFRDVPGLVLV
jgi:predicted nucleic acid-binding protein